MLLTRKNQLKHLLLQAGHSMLEEERWGVEEEKRRYMEENCPTLPPHGGIHDLQELCRKLHQRVHLVDEERYDMEAKLSKSRKEIEDLRTKIRDLKGKFRKPVLRRVRLSADAMLAALLGSRHKVSLDLRANLKQVKKGAREEEKLTGDWRKNVEKKSNMDARKKMFEAEN